MSSASDICSGSGNPLLDALVGFFKFLGDPVGTIMRGIGDLVMDAALRAFKALTSNIPSFVPTASNPVQSQLNWLVVYTAIGSLLFACIRMAAERQAEPGQTALKGMVRLIVVAGGGTAIIGAAAAVGDGFASHLYSEAIDDHIQKSMCGSSDDIPSFLYVILAFLMLIAAIIHGILLYVRLAVMIVLFGTLPIAAAASMSNWGGGWWRKHIGWMIAWLLYKPAAALIIYAGTELLSGNVPVDRPSESGADETVHTKIAGICVMLLSAIAMPALLKLIVPATAALGGGSSYTGAVTAAGGGIASGAKSIVGAGLSSKGGEGSGGRSGPSGSSGGGGQSGAGGRAGPAGRASPAAMAGAASGGGGGGGDGGGPSGSRNGRGGGGSGGGSGGSGGSGGGGRGAGGGPSGAVRGAGAAAGPVAVAAGAAEAVKGVAKGAKDLTTGAVNDANGDHGHNQ